MRRRRWTILWILIPIIAVGACLLISINYLIDPNLYRNIIQKSLTLHLGREVTMGQARISLWGGIGLVCEGFEVKDRSQRFDLLQSRKLILTAKFFPLLKRQLKWKRVVLDGPVIHLERDGKGRFNFLDAPLTKEGVKAAHQKLLQSLSTLFGGSLVLRDGEITFSDQSLGDSPLVTEIRSFNLLLSEVAYPQPFAFNITGKIGPPTKEGHFSVSGTLQNISEELDLSKGTIKGKAEIKGIDTAHFWPYLKTWLPMKRVSGMLDLNGQYEGDFSGAFKTSLKMKLREVVFDYPEVFAYVLTPRWVNLGLDVDYRLKEIKIPQISLELPEIGIKAKGKIYGIGSNETGLEAEAQSGPFDLLEAKKFIPYRIITSEVSDPLFRGEGKGPVQIISVKLSGRLSEIEHCDQLQHAHTLSIEMKLGKVRLKLPWDLPLLEDLRGNLVFEEGHLHLKEVDGNVLHSRIDGANGVIDRLLITPFLRVSCKGRFDLMDLSSFAEIGGFFKDFSKLFPPLSIRSGRAGYRLTVRGDLKPPFRFQHQGSYSLSNVTFAHREIPLPISIGEGKIDLSDEDLRWSGVRVGFGDSSLVTNGSWRQGEVLGPLDIIARGRVDLKNLLTLSASPFFPEEIRLKAREIEKLSGIGSILFKARRVTGQPSFSWEGELIPREANLLLKRASLPLTIRQGTFSFSNLGVNFTRMKVQFGNSFLIGEGSIKEGNIRLSTNGSIDLTDLPSLLRFSIFPGQVRDSIDEIQELTGEADVRMRWFGRVEDWMTSFKEGEIRVRKVFLRYRSIPLPLSDIEGSLLLSPDQFQFKELRGRLGDSLFTVSAEIPRSQSLVPAKGRWLSFQISSSNLDLDLLFPQKEKETTASFEKIRNWLSHWSVEGKVEASQVRYHGLVCQDLKTKIKTVDGKLFFRPFQLRGAGGDLWGEGWIEPAEKGIRFEIEPRLSNMEAEAFVRAFLQKGREGEVMTTGRVHIDKVELRGEGEDFQKMKESLNGSLRLEMVNGVIKRFNVLSKIFSILNVSQLFKGRLPDLRTKGLPYHQIIAHILVKDGIASTDDLVIDSDAMKITLLGKFDVGKKLIDAKIGIHPFVTLDTVLGNVPVAGYIIAGKDKAFISFIYEVRGDLENPKIEAIPIKSMGEGFWGIIRRLLETPLRPFQKTSSPK
jgi:uncharacterized protein YhdP